MKQFHFPRSRIILPEHRSTLQKQRLSTNSNPRPSPDEQRLQEFQNLLEDSIYHNRVLRIVSHTCNVKAVTTGIVKKADPHNGMLHIHTLEGVRIIYSADVVEISQDG